MADRGSGYILNILALAHWHTSSCPAKINGLWQNSHACRLLFPLVLEGWADGGWKTLEMRFFPLTEPLTTCRDAAGLISGQPIRKVAGTGPTAGECACLALTNPEPRMRAHAQRDPRQASPALLESRS
ncbi:hypothetical protein BO78DRAFT_46507 [Aspergillus sclerotiicarbonarius CBS 121057]|uniref:Uncharacterized protein n=1 Tax=Aspergillus sclerotiicarbonarius (strain CBS 121057 / IBT 28362) TaxID=1448318 RepID=A0A319EFP9_ASPSB|nr:hypothetical protein BO78DRAFT_46507 [Aspergillus sclerotiicarbonarius CBS 121057]